MTGGCDSFSKEISKEMGKITEDVAKLLTNATASAALALQHLLVPTITTSVGTISIDYLPPTSAAKVEDIVLSALARFTVKGASSPVAMPQRGPMPLVNDARSHVVMAAAPAMKILRRSSSFACLRSLASRCLEMLYLQHCTLSSRSQ